jgi:long-chain acyl-CoA synthetase
VAAVAANSANDRRFNQAYFKEVRPSMAFMTLSQTSRRGQAKAIIDEYGSCSWTELNLRVNSLIHGLQASGLVPGDRLAIFGGNSRAVFELMMAAHHAGLSYVPVNWHFTAEELAHVLVDAKALALFVDSQFTDIALQALQLASDAAPRLRLWANLGHDGLPPEGFTSFETFLAAQKDLGEPEQQAVGRPMFYTSGTTGKPKGVLRVTAGPPAPMESLSKMAQGAMSMLHLPNTGTTLLAGPYYHSAQWSFSFIPLLAGASLVMTHRFDAAQTLALIDAHAITHLHLVPTQFLRLLRLDPAIKNQFSGGSLQIVWHGAAPCPAQAKRDMIDWWGPCIHEYYGSTEGAIVTGISSGEWLQRPGSVGRTINLTDVFILRDDGSPAPTEEQGTIYMRHRLGLGLRYHNDAAKTEAAHRGAGLFTTGDVGWMDKDGYLYLTDRKIDMIISGGVNIYPAEIEATLSNHPSVLDVAVIGVPDSEFGEEVKAIVQLQSGHHASDALVDSLMQHCRASLAGYKVPRSIEFRSDFPRTATGKLQKRLLRDAYWAGSGRLI